MSRAELKVELEQAGCVIVPMTEHDLLEVVEIEETTGLSQWGWEAYRAELEKPEAVMLVARRNTPDASTGRGLSGYIAARINADELHVNNIGVRPESRRQGVGGALLGAVLEAAARRPSPLSTRGRSVAKMLAQFPTRIKRLVPAASS